VGGDDRSQSLAADDRPEQAHDGSAGPRIELTGWLVGQEDVRTVREGPGDRDALLLAAGQLVWPMTPAFAEPDELEENLDPIGPLA
jgi:hypothetical protein